MAAASCSGWTGRRPTRQRSTACSTCSTVATETAVAAARLRWTAAKAAGHQVTYWQQGERGWQKKA